MKPAQPTTEDIRDAWIGHRLSAGRTPGTTSRQVSDNAARAFDEWLAAIRTEEWDKAIAEAQK